MIQGPKKVKKPNPGCCFFPVSDLASLIVTARFISRSSRIVQLYLSSLQSTTHLSKRKISNGFYLQGGREYEEHGVQTSTDTFDISRGFETSFSAGSLPVHDRQEIGFSSNCLYILYFPAQQGSVKTSLGDS